MGGGRKTVKLTQKKRSGPADKKPNQAPRPKLTEVQLNKVLELVLKCAPATDLIRVVDLMQWRLVNKSTNETITTAPKIMDRVQFHIDKPESLYVFFNSPVTWRNIGFTYWPRVYDFNASRFWERKGQEVDHISLSLEYVDFPILQDILLGPKKLNSIKIGSDLSNINFMNNLRDASGFRQAMAAIKLIRFDVSFQKQYWDEQTEDHLAALRFLIRLIPDSQITAVEVYSGYNDSPETILKLGELIHEIIERHESSLKVLHYHATIMPASYFNSICLHFTKLQLETFTIDTLSTFHEFEKSQLDLKPFANSAYLAAHVVAFRNFSKFLERQKILESFNIQILKFNKKICKRIFVGNLCNTLRDVKIFARDYFSADALMELCKIVNLELLDLEMAGAGAQTCQRALKLTILTEAEARKSFLSHLPVSLQCVVLHQFNHLGPVCLKVMLERLPNIVKIHLGYCKLLVTDEGLQHIIHYAPRLRSLFLAPAEGLTDAGLVGERNLGQLKDLTQLSIVKSQMTNITLRNGFNFSRLSDIDISFNTKITTRGLADMLNANKCIRHFRVCPDMERKMHQLNAFKVVRNDVADHGFLESLGFSLGHCNFGEDNVIVDRKKIKFVTEKYSHLNIEEITENDDDDGTLIEAAEKLELDHVPQ